MLLYRKAILVLSLLVATISLHAANLNEAEYKQLNKEYTLNADGSYSLRVVKELTLFTHSSFNKMYGETFVVYNPQREKLTINKCYTTQVDGTVVTAPDNAFNEVLPLSAANAPAYNHIREMVITHTGLEIGATIYLDYTITTKPADGAVTPFDIKEVIQESSPIKEYTISIEAPKELTLRYELIGSSVKPKVIGDKVVFTFKSVASASVDGFQPQNGTAPILVATTANKNFVTSKFANAVSCDGVDELVKEVAVGDSDDERVKSILTYVNQRIASSAMPFIYQDNKERCPSTIIKSGYATKFEKDLLLRTMLTAAGISYDIIAIYPNYIGGDMLTLSTLKGLLFKVGGSYYSSLSITPVVISERAEVDKFYCLLADGSVATTLTLPLSPVENHYDQKISKDMASESGYIIFTPQSIDDGVRGWGLTSLPSQRTSPLELRTTTDESSVWVLELEPGVKLQSKVFEEHITTSFGSLSISLAEDGNRVVLKRSISLAKQTISQGEYAKFRNFMNVWNSTKGSKLLFEVK